MTPRYILEPSEPYEVFGDRPFVVFPCGAQVIDDSLLISYGAADSAVVIGEIKIDELMSIFDTSKVNGGKYVV